MRASLPIYSRRGTPRPRKAAEQIAAVTIERVCLYNAMRVADRFQDFGIAYRHLNPAQSMVATA
ncbi:MAG TPA: hypothetical protein VKR05_00415 [Candidatus Cybelea sp.]|nr:hypothetical protein [Candidatus Cybelea sp.]